MASLISNREVMIGIVGTVMGGVFVWLLTKNGDLTTEIEAIRQVTVPMQEVLIAANTAELRANDALARVLSVEQEAKRLVSTLDTIEILAKTDESMGELRALVKVEAERVALQYVKEAHAFVLATFYVEGGILKSATAGVSYNNGLVTFSNPHKFKFIPIISDLSAGDHMTDKHFISRISGGSQFNVWKTTLDTSSRNYAPTSFTAVVIGFGK